MSETVKLIIEIPKEEYEFIKSSVLIPPKDSYCELIVNAIPLDDVKAEIDRLPDLNPDYPMDKIIHISKWNVMQILNNIGKGVSE
jgi:hypothetical protein